MKRYSRWSGILLMVAGMSACDFLVGPDDDSGEDGGGGGGGAKAITTSAEARTLFALLRSSGEAVDLAVTAPFNGSTSVSGSLGRAAVTGKKTSSQTSTSSSSSTTTMSDLQIAYSSYRAGSSSLTVNGSMRWFEYYYSRTACSSSSCASSSDHSESMKGSAMSVQFDHGGVRYTDVVTIDADSPEYTSRWNVKITTRAGQVLSFSY